MIPTAAIIINAHLVVDFGIQYIHLILFNTESRVWSVCVQDKM
jgi:hypothetical protein